MRIAFQQTAVHIGPWVSFVRIADDVFHIGIDISADLPLEASQKSCPSPAPESRGFYFGNDFIRRHVEKDPGQSPVAIQSNVILYSSGIDKTVIAEDDPFLFFVKGNFFLLDDLLSSLRLDIQEAVYDFFVPYGFAHNLSNVFELYSLIKNAIRLNDCNRTSLTKTMASRGSHFHGSFQLLLSYFIPESICNLKTSVCMTACATTYRDIGFLVLARLYDFSFEFL